MLMNMRYLFLVLSLCCFSALSAHDIDLYKNKDVNNPPVQESTDLRASIEGNTLIITSTEEFVYTVTIKGRTITFYGVGRMTLDVSDCPQGTSFNIDTESGSYTGIIEK